jgi:hypothetical protein
MTRSSGTCLYPDGRIRGKPVCGGELGHIFYSQPRPLGRPERARGRPVPRERPATGHPRSAAGRTAPTGDLVPVHISGAQTGHPAHVSAVLRLSLGQGWYLRSRDATWTFNLRHNTSTEIPLSAGIGKVWKFRRGLRVERLVSRRMDVVLPIRFADRAVDFEIPSDDVVSAPRTMRKRRHYV